MRPQNVLLAYLAFGRLNAWQGCRTPQAVISVREMHRSNHAVIPVPEEIICILSTSLLIEHYIRTNLTCDKNRRTKLTVNHLENAVLALDIGEHVAHLNVLSIRGVVGLALLGFVDATHWVNVVAPGIVGVDRASEAVVRSTCKGVLVEALLGGHAFGVVEVGGVADEELAVTLCMHVVADVWVG